MKDGRKILAVLLAVVMVLSLAACGEGGGTTASTEPTNPEPSVDTTASTEPDDSPSEESMEESGDISWSLENGVLTISGEGAMKDDHLLNIPWKNRLDEIVSVVVEKGVTHIGDYAFADCDNLTSIDIASSVTSIGYAALSSCDALTSVTIPDSVTSIGDEVFDYSNSLTEIVVDSENPNYCSIDGVLFDKTKTTLLRYPGGKATSYAIPSGVTSIGKCAFRGCRALESVTIPDSATSIGREAFRGCDALESVTIPEGVDNIDSYAFSACDSLTSVTILGGTSIDYYVFSYCDSLTSVALSSSATIETQTFQSCPSLTDIYYGGSEAEWIERQYSYYFEDGVTPTIHYNSSMPE